MKKVLILMLLMIFIFLGCNQKKEIITGDLMNKINDQYNQYFSINSLFVFKTEDTYFIVIEKEGVIENSVKFSSDRKPSNIQNLSLIQCENISDYLDVNINTIIKKYGDPHVDIGSGFYIPTYITEDAYLICFELDNSIVSEVIKRDIITNEIVERETKEINDGSNF